MSALRAAPPSRPAPAAGPAQRPVRVLMVGPDVAAPGGIASVVQGYLEEGFAPPVRLAFVPTHVDGGPRRRLGRYSRAVSEVASVLRRGDADVLHVHLSMGGSLVRKGILAALAHRAGVALVLHVHGSHFDEHVTALPRPATALVRRLLASADAVVALSTEWRDRLTRLAPGAHIVVIPNGVAVPPVPAELDGGPFVTLGRVERRKGSFDLLAALAAVEGPGVQLVVAGDGAVDELRALAVARDLAGRLSVREWIDSRERDRLLQGAIGFVLPSYAEGLPMALLEAMAHGLPVVATPVGGVPEVVEHERSGLLVAPGDVAGLAAALTRLAADPDLRHRLGTEARRVIQSGYTRGVAMGRLTSLWREVAAA